VIHTEQRPLFRIYAECSGQLERDAVADEDISSLRQALLDAQAFAQEAQRKWSEHRTDNADDDDYSLANAALMFAERALAKAESRPFAILEDFPYKWDIGAPTPLLIASDNRTTLLFYLSDVDFVAIVEFDCCYSTCFGSPGDEIFSGHPLYGSGFEPYTAMRVMNSSWIQNLKEMDSVHWRHDPSLYLKVIHYIFPFHDSTFECVARGYEVRKERGNVHKIAREILDRSF